MPNQTHEIKTTISFKFPGIYARDEDVKHLDSAEFVGINAQGEFDFDVKFTQDGRVQTQRLSLKYPMGNDTKVSF